MKNIIIYLVLLFAISNTNLIIAQNDFHVNVKNAIVSGNYQKLASFFNQNIELIIKNKEDVYSKAQAEHILKDFFSKNVPDDFVIEIDEQSDGSRYVIGNLFTSGGKYRVYVVYSVLKGKTLISRLNFSEYN